MWVAPATLARSQSTATDTPRARCRHGNWTENRPWPVRASQRKGTLTVEHQASLSLEASLRDTTLDVESGFIETPCRALAISMVALL